MQPTGINPGLVRALTAAMPDVVTELLTPGRTLQADVDSVYQDRAILAFGRGFRLEVNLQAPLQEGQRVKVQVQPRAATEQTALQAQPDAGQLLTARQAPNQPPILLRLLSAEQPQAASQATQTQPASAQAQPASPQVMWLPIPLPDGSQGWAQLHVQEDASPRTRAAKGGPAQQVRIWWETPALGAVQVSMEAATGRLSAIFTTASSESRMQVEESVPDLRQRLAEAGFPEASVGCRTAPPGEPVAPMRVEGASRLDRRL